MIFVGKQVAVSQGLFSWPSCLGAEMVFHQRQGPTGRRVAFTHFHSPLGQASPEGQISHCDKSERLLRLLNVPGGQAWVGAWGLEEPTGHAYL